MSEFLSTVSNAFRSDRFRRLSIEGSWIILGQVMAVLGSLIGVRILTGMMSPAAFGELALGMTVATLVGQVVIGPLGNGVTRFYAPAVEQGALDGYFKSVGRMVLWATGIILILAMIAVAGLQLSGRQVWIAIVTAAFFFAIFSGYNSMLSGIQNAARQRSIVALHQGVEPWARFLGAAGLMIWLGATSTVAMVGYCAAVTLVLLSQFLFFRKSTPAYQSGTGNEKQWQENIWNYSWPFASWGLFTWAQLASDRWALELFATTREVGLYAVLYQLGYYPMSMATGMAVQLLMPIFYQRAGDASDSRRNANVSSLSWRLAGFALGVTGAAFLLALLLHTQIFRIFVGKQYASISYLLPWMLLAGGVFASGQTLSLNLMSQMKTHVMARAKIVTAISGILFNYAGAYLFGIRGVVSAGVLFSFFYFLWVALLSKKVDESAVCEFGRSSK
jgi:Membrane protein involved in the export of O-antigen and teichoic acid